MLDIKRKQAKQKKSNFFKQTPYNVLVNFLKMLTILSKFLPTLFPIEDELFVGKTELVVSIIIITIIIITFNSLFSVDNLKYINTHNTKDIK